ncbi:MAG: glycosyl hydrolase 2 galactose-binding domain-containing protein, partial [Chitinophagales bacterium]
MEINLNQNWQFRKAGDTAWLPATVPGCVHTDLLANNLIPDPFYADNEKQVQWIENEDWEYQTIFIVDKKMLRREFIELQFEGLDTYADVFLNDSLILKSDNMFRSWNIDVKKYLLKGENKLYIKFSSAVRVGKELMNNYPVKLPGEERVFTRKAQYQYGWDWGPRLVTA